jgi:hypothetical protein
MTMFLEQEFQKIQQVLLILYGVWLAKFHNDRFDNLILDVLIS